MTSITSSNEAVLSDRLNQVKSKQRDMWGSGDYAVIGATLQIVGELLNEAADVSAGDRVLDVAAGSGNATLANAIGLSCTLTATYSVSTVVVWLCRTAVPSPVRKACWISSRRRWFSSVTSAEASTSESPRT